MTGGAKLSQEMDRYLGPMVEAAAGQWERELRDLGEWESAQKEAKSGRADDVGAGGGEGRAG